MPLGADAYLYISTPTNKKGTARITGLSERGDKAVPSTDRFFFLPDKVVYRVRRTTPSYYRRVAGKLKGQNERG